MSDQYAHVAKGVLKLKDSRGVSVPITKKKKSRRSQVKCRASQKTEDKITAAMNPSPPCEPPVVRKPPPPPVVEEFVPPVRTSAETKFYAMHHQRQKARIIQKAEKTHKQKVEAFNKHLDSLSEHYDIPKVSWTK